MPSTATSILDGLSTSVAVKSPCRTVTTSNITLAGLQTISGYTTVENDRVLVVAQTNPVENGIYMASTGSWRRAKDADGNRDLVQGTRVIVRSGSVDGVEYELTTANPIVIDTTALTFVLRYGANATYDRTQAEIAGSITPVNYAVPSHKQTGGSVYPSRYFNNTVPGTTDCTAALNAVADFCRSQKLKLRLEPEIWYCTGSVDFDLIRVEGPTADMAAQLKFGPSNATYNCIIGRESFSWANFRADGPWNGSTTSLAGDLVHIDNDGGTGFAYNGHLHNITLQNACKRLLYWKDGGYGSLYNIHANAAGLHALEFEGTLVGTPGCTTITVGGNSIFSNAPNGYGAKLTQCASIHFGDVIMEDTQGIQINGNDNRALSFDNVYQENFTVATGTYLDCGTSGGIGLSVTNSFGGNKSIPYPTNWQNLHYAGNSNMGESAVPYAGRVALADGGELTTSTTGGVSVTAATASLGPGTWLLFGTLQTADAGSLNLTDAGCTLTTNVADGGANSSTSTFEVATARTDNGSAVAARRLHCMTIYQNTTTGSVNMYLRSRLTFSAGTCAYRGNVTAVRLQ